MRAVAGIVFVFLGLVMGYYILAGKFPNTSTSSGTTGSSTAPPSIVIPGASANENQQANRVASRNIGGGPMGLPTMAHFNDLVASQGGMRQ
jgi:hypothetical protein